jgi:hypothetical protein
MTAQLQGLRELSMHHVDVDALHCLAGLSSLESLSVCVCFPFAPLSPTVQSPSPRSDAAKDCSWLDWAAGLTDLTFMSISASPLSLQPEAGIETLTLLTRLETLKLRDCVLLTDAGANRLTRLPQTMRFLEASPSRLSENGLTRLLGALPGLERLEKVALCEAGALRVALGSTRLLALACKLSMTRDDLRAALALAVEPPPAVAAAVPQEEMEDDGIAVGDSEGEHSPSSIAHLEVLVPHSSNAHYLGGLVTGALTSLQSLE